MLSCRKSLDHYNRSDWGRSQGQEVVLAIRLRRAFLDALLQNAKHTENMP